MNDTCLFIENLECCKSPKAFMSNFCDQHKDYYKDRTNEEIIDDIAHGMKDCLFITENKKIGAVQDMSAWANFTNLFNELISRGYQYEEIVRSIRSIQETKGILDDI